MSDELVGDDTITCASGLAGAESVLVHAELGGHRDEGDEVVEIQTTFHDDSIGLDLSFEQDDARVGVLGEMTPGQARTVAASLVRLADAVEEHGGDDA